MIEEGLMIRFKGDVSDLESKSKQATSIVQNQFTKINTVAQTAVQGVSKLGNTIETLRGKLEAKKQFLLTETDITKISAYNKEIEVLQKEIDRVGSAGKKGFDAMGNAITKIGNPLQTAFSSVRQLAYILPGVGIAGIIGFAAEPIINYVQKLLGAEEETSKFKKALNELKSVTNSDLLEGASGEFSKAVSSIETLRENVNLAKKGFIDKKEVVDEYNKTLGDTIGKVKTLDEVEKAIASKGDAYIKFTLLKAAAQEALKKSSDAALQVAEQQTKLFKIPTTSEIADQFKGKQDVPGALIEGRKKFFKDLNKPTEQGISQAKVQQQKFIDIFKGFQDEAAKIAKENNFKFETKFDTKSPKDKSQFNFFEQFFDVKPDKDKIEKQMHEMAKVARDFAVKNLNIFQGLDKIISAAGEENVIAQGKIFWDNYQKGLVKFKIPKLIPAKDLFPVAPDEIAKEAQATVEEFTKSMQQAFSGQKNINTNEDLTVGALLNKEQILDQFKTQFAQLQDELPTVINRINPVTGIEETVSVKLELNTANLQKGLQEHLNQIRSAIKDFQTQMGAAIRSAQINALKSVGQGIGAALAGDTNGIRSAGQGIVDVFSSLLEQMGESLIQYGLIKTGVDKILKGGILIPGVAAIGLGVAAIAAANLVKSLSHPKAFADGGIVSGPTLAYVGEYNRASTDPEVISPLSKLRGMIADVGGGGAGGVLVARGNDLMLVHNRTNRRQKRGG